MAEQGYWVVCEDLYAGNKKTREPAMCMGHVNGFHYSEAMGGSRMEVLATIRKKLQENIRFLMDCYNDVPVPSFSDNPPLNDNIPNAAYVFLGLREISMTPEMIESVS